MTDHGTGVDVVGLLRDYDCGRCAACRRLKVAAAAEIERLRAENTRLDEECQAWSDGVADLVEQFGYDRMAANGPADLLPGLVPVAIIVDAYLRSTPIAAARAQLDLP